MNSKELIGVLGLAAAGVVGYYMAKTYIRVHKVSQKLDKTFAELENLTEVEIKESIVDKAVEEKATEAAERAVKRSAAVISTDLENDLKKDIKKAVDAEYELIKGSVKTRIESEIKDLNIDSVKREVVQEAKNTAAKKFEKDLDDVLDKYNTNLEKVTNIYSSIAQKMNPKQTFEF